MSTTHSTSRLNHSNGQWLPWKKWMHLRKHFDTDRSNKKMSNKWTTKRLITMFVKNNKLKQHLLKIGCFFVFCFVFFNANCKLCAMHQHPLQLVCGEINKPKSFQKPESVQGLLVRLSPPCLGLYPVNMEPPLKCGCTQNTRLHSICVEVTLLQKKSVPTPTVYTRSEYTLVQNH